jgi:hypothetical protein
VCGTGGARWGWPCPGKADKKSGTLGLYLCYSVFHLCNSVSECVTVCVTGGGHTCVTVCNMCVRVQ